MRRARVRCQRNLAYAREHFIAQWTVPGIRRELCRRETQTCAQYVDSAVINNLPTILGSVVRKMPTRRRHADRSDGHYADVVGWYARLTELFARCVVIDENHRAHLEICLSQKL